MQSGAGILRTPAGSGWRAAEAAVLTPFQGALLNHHGYLQTHVGLLTHVGVEVAVVTVMVVTAVACFNYLTRNLHQSGEYGVFLEACSMMAQLG